MAKKLYNVNLYQCDGFCAILHQTTDAAVQTQCGLRPSNKQWESGAISYEHDISTMTYTCQICLPPKKVS